MQYFMCIKRCNTTESYNKRNYPKVNEIIEYVGETAKSDGTLLGDFRKFMNYLFVTELVRGIHIVSTLFAV